VQEHFENSPVTTLRDCLEFNSDRQPIDISEVSAGAVGGSARQPCPGMLHTPGNELAALSWLR